MRELGNLPSHGHYCKHQRAPFGKVVQLCVCRLYLQPSATPCSTRFVPHVNACLHECVRAQRKTRSHVCIHMFTRTDARVCMCCGYYWQGNEGEEGLCCIQGWHRRGGSAPAPKKGQDAREIAQRPAARATEHAATRSNISMPASARASEAPACIRERARMRGSTGASMRQDVIRVSGDGVCGAAQHSAAQKVSHGTKGEDRSSYLVPVMAGPQTSPSCSSTRTCTSTRDFGNRFSCTAASSAG